MIRLVYDSLCSRWFQVDLDSYFFWWKAERPWSTLSLIEPLMSRYFPVNFNSTENLTPWNFHLFIMQLIAYIHFTTLLHSASKMAGLAAALWSFGDNKITPSDDVLQCGNKTLDKLLRIICDKSPLSPPNWWLLVTFLASIPLLEAWSPEWILSTRSSNLAPLHALVYE